MCVEMGGNLGMGAVAGGRNFHQDFMFGAGNLVQHTVRPIGHTRADRAIIDHPFIAAQIGQGRHLG